MKEQAPGGKLPLSGTDNALGVRFWGVRGSVACCGPDFMRYGGNTCCVEVRCGDHLLIFDAGTGIRALGERIKAAGAPRFMDLFLSHTHYDHIEGLPFFAPLFCGETKVRVWLGRQANGLKLKETLKRLMEQPFFPVDPAIFKARMEFRDFHPGDMLPVADGITVGTLPLVHPNGSTGFRVDCHDRSVCYLTDTEHQPGVVDPGIVSFARGCGLVIYDSMYTEDEFPAHRGWGHSTWQHGMRLVEAASADRLAAFHLNPAHEDWFLDRVEAELKTHHARSFVARDGLIVTV